MLNKEFSMRSSVLAAVASTGLMLAGCSTPYQDMGLMGGVSATQIDGNTISVTAHGNAFTSASTIKNYTILKAADETVAAGYDYFAMGDETDESRHGVLSFASGSSYSNSWYGSGFSTETIKPGENVLVKMYHGQKPEDAPPNYFDAHEVEDYLGKTVKGFAQIESHANSVTQPKPVLTPDLTAEKPSSVSDMHPYQPSAPQPQN